MLIFNRVRRISLTQFLFYNFFSRKVVRKGSGKIIPYKNTIIDIGKKSKIILIDGNLYVNNNKPGKSKAEAYIKLRDNAKLIIHNTTYLNYRAMIEIHSGAEMEIGSAYINSDSVLVAKKKINIGEDVQMARFVTIFDSDHHSFLDEDDNITNPSKEVEIGNHVWIGLKSTILRGSKIGDGAMIAAGSLVGGRIKAGTMGFGNPARSFSDIRWRT